MAQENIDKLKKLEVSLTDPSFYSELFYKLFESSPDAIILANSDGLILMVNGQAELMFGYVKRELQGRDIEVLIPESLRNNHIKYRQTYMDDPRIRPMGIGTNLMGLHKSGKEIQVEINLSPIVVGEGMLVVATVRRKRDA